MSLPGVGSSVNRCWGSPSPARRGFGILGCRCTTRRLGRVIARCRTRTESTGAHRSSGLRRDARQWSSKSHDVTAGDRGLTGLLEEIQSCRICAAGLALGPRRIVQLDPAAPILVVGQAPGREANASAVSLRDANGERLRRGIGVDAEVLSDPTMGALWAMGSCFAGSGPSGDVPPRPECAPEWRENSRPTGRCLVDSGEPTLCPALSLAPSTGFAHRGRRGVAPSLAGRGAPRASKSPNNIEIRKNPWFEEESVRALRELIQAVLAENGWSTSRTSR